MGNSGAKGTSKSSLPPQKASGGDSDDRPVRPTSPEAHVYILGNSQTGKTTLCDAVSSAVENDLQAEPEATSGKFSVSKRSDQPNTIQLQLEASSIKASIYIHEISGFASPPASVEELRKFDARKTIIQMLYVADNNVKQSIDDTPKWKAQGDEVFSQWFGNTWPPIDNYLILNKVPEGGKPSITFSDQEKMKVSCKFTTILTIDHMDTDHPAIVRISSTLSDALKRMVTPVVDDGFCED